MRRRPQDQAKEVVYAEHLEEISVQVARGAQVVVVCDGWLASAGPATQVPENMTLLPLPPYSPELNPMEKIWDS
jgi:hypothetical protein